MYLLLIKWFLLLPLTAVTMFASCARRWCISTTLVYPPDNGCVIKAAIDQTSQQYIEQHQQGTPFAMYAT